MSAAELEQPVGRELLDDPGGDPGTVARSLRNIARSNRWFGGWTAVAWGLDRLVGGTGPGSILSLLDIGTGSGDLPAFAVRWGAARGIRIVPVGLERHRIAARMAQAGGLATTLGCAGALPVRTRSVDLVLVSQVAHHFAPVQQIRLFQECDRIARHGVIIADLRRSEIATAGFWLGARLLRFDEATRADGVTSIRRGFTDQDLSDRLRQAGITAAVRRRPWFRLLAAWRPGASE